MTDFYLTRMGQRYFESTMPRLASAMERIANQLERRDDGPLDNDKAAVLLARLIGDNETLIEMLDSQGYEVTLKRRCVFTKVADVLEESDAES